MSTTSGPVVPESTGKSSVLPSGSLSWAVFSAMAVSLCSAKALYDGVQSGIVRVAAAGDDIPKVVVRQVEQLVEGTEFVIFQGGDEALENHIQLEKAAPRLPLDPFSRKATHQIERFTSNSRMWLMAFVGLSPFGHTSTQFMMVWQRNRRYGSSRLSRRSLVAWSRLS